MESAMNLENAPQSSAADLSNFLTKERLTAALRDVAQLKINEAMYLSCLSALECKLQYRRLQLRLQLLWEDR